MKILHIHTCIHTHVRTYVRMYVSRITRNLYVVTDMFIGGDIDYGSGPYTVMFPAGSTTASLSISVNNDNIVEMNETFSLTITPPIDIMATDPDNAVVTIADDDSE